MRKSTKKPTGVEHLTTNEQAVLLAWPETQARLKAAGHWARAAVRGVGAKRQLVVTVRGNTAASSRELCQWDVAGRRVWPLTGGFRTCEGILTFEAIVRELAAGRHGTGLNPRFAKAEADRLAKAGRVGGVMRRTGRCGTFKKMRYDDDAGPNG